MIDLDYLEYLEGFLTDNRKQRFLEVLKNRTNHFTIAMEDVYQLHNTSAVMRSCEVFGIQELNVVEQKFGKRIDTEIAMGAQKWVDINRYNSMQNCIDSLRDKAIKSLPPRRTTILVICTNSISLKKVLFFSEQKNKAYRQR